MSSKSARTVGPGFQWTPDKIVAAVVSAYGSGIYSRAEARALLCPFFGNFDSDAKPETPPASASEAEALPRVEVPGGEDEIEKARRQVG